MRTSPESYTITARPYVVGFVVALVLTAVPFGVVATRALAPVPTFTIIATAAIAQIVIHLRYFLHIGFRKSSRERLITLTFAFVLLVLMVGGSIWIMFDLHARMH